MRRGADMIAGLKRATIFRRRVSKFLRYCLIVLLAVVVAFPIYATLVDAFLSPADIARRPPLLFPIHPVLSGFRGALSEGNLGLYLRNSFIVSLATTLGQVVTSLLAAYAVAFIDFPGKRLGFSAYIASLMVPMEATIVANHQTIVELGWFNTYLALIVPFLASGLGVFMLRQAMLSLPFELIEAAKVEGASHLRILSKVVLPLVRPTIGALSLFSFLGSWNQYLWPLVVTQSDSVRTVQIGLRRLEAVGVDHINVIFAGTVLAALPIGLVLLIFQRQLVRGLTAGALKG